MNIFKKKKILYVTFFVIIGFCISINISLVLFSSKIYNKLESFSYSSMGVIVFLFLCTLAFLYLYIKFVSVSIVLNGKYLIVRNTLKEKEYLRDELSLEKVSPYRHDLMHKEKVIAIITKDFKEFDLLVSLLLSKEK